jgi:hypothetical protein
MFLESACNYLVSADAPAACDLIFVLAGRPERKPFGLKLHAKTLAPRLILSVGRFEVRQTAEMLGNVPDLLMMRDRTAPQQRHFWLDFHDGRPTISAARLKRPSTFWELQAMADYLESEPPASIGIVSTSIHLRRVRFCCSRIPFFKSRSLYLLPIPEEQSGFQRRGWWTRADHWSYLASEYVKLVAYRVLY